MFTTLRHDLDRRDRDTSRPQRSPRSSARSPTPPRFAPDSTRRDDVAGALFSIWVVAGLFLDGWAHNAGKPESFWTPWHGVLYSGFVAAALWFAVDGMRQRRRGIEVRTDRLVLLGYGIFAFAGVADMAWHTVFGIEEDLAALLSPSHLALMAGGLLLVTTPVRNALAAGTEGAAGPPPTSSWRAFAPAAVGITLAVAIVAFFLQFDSALHFIDDAAYPAGVSHPVFERGASDGGQVQGVAGILLANALLLGAVAWTLGRWARPPAGTFTLILGGTALMTAGLDGFDQIGLVAPVAAAGAVTDVLIRRGVRPAPVLVVTPIVLWAGWFATYHAVWGLGWPAELWTGSLVLTGLTGFGLSLLLASSASSVSSASWPARRADAAPSVPAR